MQETLASLVHVIAPWELEIDRSRHAIKTLSAGQYQKALHLVDRNQSGFITGAEIAQFLRAYRIDGTKDEIEAIVSYYDFSRQGGLNVQDFIAAITPREDSTASKKLEDKELDTALVRFFSREIDLSRQMHSYKQQLVNSDIWTSFDSFKCIDTKGKGSFTCTDLDAFLQKNGVVLSNAEITAAFNRLDKESKNKVTFPDFQANLLGENPTGERMISKFHVRDSYKPRSALIKTHSIETPTFISNGGLSQLHALPTRSISPHTSPLRLNHTQSSISPPPLNAGPLAHQSIPSNISPISSPKLYATPGKSSPYISPFNSDERVRRDIQVSNISRSPRPLSQTLVDRQRSYLESSPTYTRDPLATPQRKSPGTYESGYAGYAGYSPSLPRQNYNRPLTTENFGPPPLSLPGGGLFGGAPSSTFGATTYVPIQRTYEPRHLSMTMGHVPRYY